MRINNAEDFCMDDYIQATVEKDNTIIEVSKDELETIHKALEFFIKENGIWEVQKAGYILREIDYFNKCNEETENIQGGFYVNEIKAYRTFL